MSETKKHLSYSGYQKYVTCPKMYDFHYNQRIRPVAQSTNLIFGSAVDKALNEILLGKHFALAYEAARQELTRLLTEKFEIEPSDYDGELLTETLREELFFELKKLSWSGNNLDALASSLFQRISLGQMISANENKALLTLIMASFLAKTELMINAFIKHVLPKIEEIVSVQTNVKRGILDFQAKFKGIDGVVTCDNKTSARPYAADSVIGSVQLAGYGATKGAYIVFNKVVRKNRTKVCSKCGNNGTGKRHNTCDNEVDKVRCHGEWNETISPEVIPQIIIDEIPEHNRTMVEEAYSNAEKLIEVGVFPRNLMACGKQWGKPCAYIGLCWNGDMTGLVKKEDDVKT